MMPVKVIAGSKGKLSEAFACDTSRVFRTKARISITSSLAINGLYLEYFPLDLLTVI